jgi:hypothetical protein
MGSKGKSDISNFAIRAFLQKVGEAYDTARKFEPFKPTIIQWKETLFFFENKCCYCNAILKPNDTTKDHLIPLNKESLGLHAWGNVVPCCGYCNRQKHSQNWNSFLRIRSNTTTYNGRKKKIRAFQRKYHYDPNLQQHTNLRTIAANLYEDVGEVSMTLIGLRYKQAEKEIAKITRSKGRSARKRPKIAAA